METVISCVIFLFSKAGRFNKQAWPECHIIKYFPYIPMSLMFLMSKVVYKAGCWDCNACYIGKTKRRLHDMETEHFKALRSTNHASAVADNMTLTGHRIKCDPFDILATDDLMYIVKLKKHY